MTAIPTDATPAEAAPRAEPAAKVADIQIAAEVQAELMLALAATGLQIAAEPKDVQTPVVAAPAELPSDADASLPPADVEVSDATALPAAAQPVAVPVAVPVPALAETVAPVETAEPLPVVASAPTNVKAASADPAVDTIAVEPAPVAAKAAAPISRAFEHLPAVEPVGKKSAPEADKPAVVKAETASEAKPAAPETEAPAPKVVSRSADPAPAPAPRDSETPDTAPKMAAVHASPENAPNPAALLPAPNAVTGGAPHAAQPSAQAVSAETVPVAGLAVEIAAHAQNGKNRFEIRLDPPELGRIDVRLDVDKDGQVTSHLRVERAETLDLLRRDAPALERALQQAGLKTSDSGLQFSLRDQPFAHRDQNRDAPAMARVLVADDIPITTAETQRNYGRLAGLRGGVDIRV